LTNLSEAVIVISRSDLDPEIFTTAKEATVPTLDPSQMLRSDFRDVPARDSVAAVSAPLDLVPRIRPLFSGGYSDMLAMARHHRREHDRQLAAQRAA
jgi:hypothetical protein